MKSISPVVQPRLNDKGNYTTLHRITYFSHEEGYLWEGVKLASSGWKMCTV